MYRLRHIAILLLFLPVIAFAQSARMAELIHDEACEANIPARYAFAIARTTSQFDPAYQARNGGIGVMAVLPQLAAAAVPGSQRWLDHPPTNVHAAMRVLADLQQKHNNWETTLTIYRNASTRSSFDSRRWVRSVLRMAERQTPHDSRYHRIPDTELDDFGYRRPRDPPPLRPIPRYTEGDWLPIHCYDLSRPCD